MRELSGFCGFSPDVIDETEAARAMKIVHEDGIDITQKAIWTDRERIGQALKEVA